MLASMPTETNTLDKAVIITAPNSPPIKDPFPPDILVPPITTAASVCMV